MWQKSSANILTSKKYHNDPEAFDEYIHSLIKDDDRYYLILDEVQLVSDFESVLNGLLYDGNIDVYITGSNSKFLSSDVITEFRGRGDQIHLQPLSFSEFYNAVGGDKAECWNEYLTFGGMPLVLSQKTDSEKTDYLKGLFKQTYFTDIVERNQIKRMDVLDALVDLLASSVGSLTNPQKYYFADLGLRNARLNFRQQEESHLMENAIYNELLVRGYNVDVGVVKGSMKPWHTEDGILVIGLLDFLLDQHSLEK